MYTAAFAAAFLFLCVAVMIISIMSTPKPPGWIALALAVLSILLFFVGWPMFSHLR
jgi:hypothetical protein